MGNIGTGKSAGKGLSAGAKVVLRDVEKSGVLEKEDFQRFSDWLKWLHDSDRADPEFLELFIDEIIPPILRSADAAVLSESLADKETATDVVYLIRLAIREDRRAVRFMTIMNGLSERLLAPKQKEVSVNILPTEGAGAGEYQSRIGSIPQTI